MPKQTKDDAAELASLFAADAIEAEPRPAAAPTWIPPHHPTLEGASGYASTCFAVFDWWWATIEVKDDQHGVWSHLYEWDSMRQDWVYITRYWGATVSQAHKLARDTARRILVEGARPEAMRRSLELERLVTFWRANGTHLLARDPD